MSKWSKWTEGMHIFDIFRWKLILNVSYNVKKIRNAKRGCSKGQELYNKILVFRCSEDFWDIFKKIFFEYWNLCFKNLHEFAKKAFCKTWKQQNFFIGNGHASCKYCRERIRPVKSPYIELKMLGALYVFETLLIKMSHKEQNK